MKLIEIRNNLIKLSYNEDERPTLGQFLALTGDNKSYVAQYVNLKADNVNNFAVAKLMFSFTQEGVVSEYDGSAPSIISSIVPLPASELLSLLPVETQIKIGKMSGCSDELNLDISLFEHNFTVFCENDYEKATVISNCVRQLFRMKEKSVIIDNNALFGEYTNFSVGHDFKLPLNSEFIDFIFENELKGVDIPTRAVIQDIFYAVQQYIKTLKDEFLPIENFIDVVTSQYKESQMPELALLKNKLLKYRDRGIFANSAEEIKALENKLVERNCIVINIKDLDDGLQKYVISYVHKILEKFDKYVYFFLPLEDENSDKKLIKKLINHNHVFTTMFVSHNYKYASELKSHAQEVMFFTPKTMQNDFAAYNTFLNKLNPAEGVIYGKLTQGIPIIISLDDLELDLTKEDVFGDRQRFVPAIEEDILNNNDIYAVNNMQEMPQIETAPYIEEYQDAEQDSLYNSEPEQQDEVDTSSYSEENAVQTEPQEYQNSGTIAPIANILSDDYEKQTMDIEAEPPQTIDNLPFEDTQDANLQTQDYTEQNTEQLTEDDLDFIENAQQVTEQGLDLLDEDSIDSESTPPVVPIYNTDEGEEVPGENFGIKAGDRISHPRYGNGIVEKIIKYGNKVLCSIDFENVGRRLLDPSVSDFEKV